MNDVWTPCHTLIVGAGPGIGSNIARIAAGAGSHLTLVARTHGTLDAVRQQLLDDGVNVPIRTLIADATDPQGLADLITAFAENAQPPIDLALFNVSMWVPGGIDANLDEVSRGLDAGAVSALAMSQALVPIMETLPRAALAFTGGGSADVPMTASLALGMQKAAMRNLALGLARVLEDTSISVKTLTIRGTIAADTPFSPEAIARALWEWMLSPEATVESYFTGADVGDIGTRAAH